MVSGHPSALLCCCCLSNTACSPGSNCHPLKTHPFLPPSPFEDRKDPVLCLQAVSISEEGSRIYRKVMIRGAVTIKRKTSNKPQLRGILQNPCPTHLGMVKAVKTKSKTLFQRSPGDARTTHDRGPAAERGCYLTQC